MTFNAALFAIEIRIAEYIWQNITIDTIVPYNKLNYLQRTRIINWRKEFNHIQKILHKNEWKSTSKDAIKEIANNYIDVDKIRKNKRICYAVCMNYRFQIKYFKVNEYNTTMAKEIILASASFL